MNVLHRVLSIVIAISACLPVSAAAAEVTAVTLTGESISGQWAGMSAGKFGLVVAGQKKQLEPAELMALRWRELTASAPASAPADSSLLLYLADGSRFSARITAGDARHVRVQSSVGGELDLPMSALAAVRFGPASPAGEEAMASARSSSTGAEDTLLVIREGKVIPVRGAVESLGTDGGSFRWRERTIPMRPGSAYAVVLATVARPAPAQATCVLTDGSIWAGRLTGATASDVQLETSFGSPIDLPVSRLAEIRFHSDRVTFLSDLEPKAYVFEPFGVTQWPYRRDRSVSNAPLRIAEQAFERGLGMHSQSRLEYELPAGAQSLAATIGIDSAARPRGSVVFRVLVDGKELYNSGAVTGRDPPRPIVVALRGARRLQLCVDFGTDLDIGDQADWADARLIR